MALVLLDVDPDIPVLAQILFRRILFAHLYGVETACFKTCTAQCALGEIDYRELFAHFNGGEWAGLLAKGTSNAVVFQHFDCIVRHDLIPLRIRVNDRFSERFDQFRDRLMRFAFEHLSAAARWWREDLDYLGW